MAHLRPLSSAKTDPNIHLPSSAGLSSWTDAPRSEGRPSTSRGITGFAGDRTDGASARSDRPSVSRGISGFVADRMERVNSGNRAPTLPLGPDPALGHDQDPIENNINHAIFPNTDEIKAKVRQNLTKKTYNVRDCYKESGIWRDIATNQYFEALTLLVIFSNAIWIWVDTDLNKKEILNEAEPVFQVVEHLFCAFFSFEWFARFMAFRLKRDAMRDAWFIFDSLLVTMMVAETWVMTAVTLATGVSNGAGGDASVLRIARLLRLTRMARMARLLRAMPELMILIKGMLTASRSVFFTLLLLVMQMYVFAIAMTQLLEGTDIGQRKFSRVAHSMASLWIHGALLDDVSWMTSRLSRESHVCTFIFFVFVLMAALTVMNMLIGVLCEVVSAVATQEREEMQCGWVREKLRDVVRALDTDGNNEISKEEFLQILEIPEVCRLLEEVGVDVIGLVDSADAIFQSKGFQSTEGDTDEAIDFAEFMQMVLQLRGSNTATVKDVVELRKFFRDGVNQMQARVSALHKDLNKVCELQRLSLHQCMNGEHPSKVSAVVPAHPFSGYASMESAKDRANAGQPSDLSPRNWTPRVSFGPSMVSDDLSASDLRGTWIPWDPRVIVTAAGSRQTTPAAADTDKQSHVADGVGTPPHNTGHTGYARRSSRGSHSPPQAARSDHYANLTREEMIIKRALAPGTLRTSSNSSHGGNVEADLASKQSGTSVVGTLDLPRAPGSAQANLTSVNNSASLSSSTPADARLDVRASVLSDVINNFIEQEVDTQPAPECAFEI